MDYTFEWFSLYTEERKGGDKGNSGKDKGKEKEKNRK